MKNHFLSKLPFELMIGLRYTFAKKKGRKDGFVSFISVMSVLSIAVGVMALIIVLSVMNGFQKQVRDKMLSVLSHVEVISTRGTMRDWKTEANHLEQSFNEMQGAAPFARSQALVSNGVNIKGVQINGIDPASESKVSDVSNSMVAGKMSELKPGDFKIVIGIDLARQLGVVPGEKISVIVPQGQHTPAGLIPRTKQFTVGGIFNSGHYEFDSSMCFIDLEDAAKLFKISGPTGLRIKLDDMQEAPKVAYEINRQKSSDYYAVDWSNQNRTWFAAVQVEKRMMGVILFLIVLVGAFGLVSSLVMTVNSKRNDIAILRTLGASKSSIMKIFIVQGAIIGLIGVSGGVLLGLLVSFNISGIVGFIENLFSVQFLPKEIYFISQMPSDPRASDIVPISIFSLVLALLATIYPSWRASRIQPAEALRYE